MKAELALISRFFLSSSISNLAARGVYLVSGFAATVIIVRILTPADYGLYALLIMLVSYTIVVCDLGLSNGLLRFGGEWRKRSHTWSLLRMTVALQLLAAVCLLGVSVLFKSAVEAAYGVSLGPFLVFAVVLAFFTVLRNDMQSLRIASGRAVAIVVANLAFAGLWVGGLLMLAEGQPNVLQVLELQVAALIVVVALLIFLPSAPSQSVPRSGQGKPSSTLVTYSLAFVARGLVTLVVMKQSEVFFLGHYQGLSIVAQYNVAYSFSFFALMSAHQALYPVAVASLTRAAAAGAEKLRRAVQVYYKLIFLHIVPIAVTGTVVGDMLVTTLYGSKMAPAGSIAQVFFLANTMPFVTSGVAVGMLALARPWAGMHLSVAMAGFNLALDAILIPRYGVGGAVAAVVGTGLVGGAAFLQFYKRFLGPGLVPWRYLGRCCLAAAPIFGLATLRSSLTGPGSLLALLFVAVLVYVIGIRLFRLIEGEERRLLESSGFALARWVARALGT